jgi:uncharacterized radical SAM superfamily protein
LTGPRLIERGRLNPGYLKLELFCRGLRLGAGCRLDGRQEQMRVRAGLGSGLEMRIDGTAIHVNAPVVEAFAADSPYELRGPRADGRHLLFRDGVEVAAVRLLPRPRFYEEHTSSGKRMDSVGSIQGTYLGVYYGQLCANWKRPEADACRFCAVGQSVREGDDRTDKSPADVVEVARAARKELGITFVHVNGGFDDSGRYLERFGPVVEALRRETGLLIGLQLPPLPEADHYRAFRALGVNNVSLCFETWDPRRFAAVCPGKDRRAGLQSFQEAIRHCAQTERFDTTNGELIVGLEEVANSLEAIDWLTGVGAIPTICVFRPVRGTHYEDLPPPQIEDVLPVFAHAYRRCMERGLPIGIAPRVNVSIVMNPEEGRWLLPPAERGRWRLRRLRHRAMRTALGLYVRRRAAVAQGVR